MRGFLERTRPVSVKLLAGVAAASLVGASMALVAIPGPPAEAAPAEETAGVSVDKDARGEAPEDVAVEGGIEGGDVEEDSVAGDGADSENAEDFQEGELIGADVEGEAHPDVSGQATSGAAGSPAVFSAGNVVSDAVFYNQDAMSEAQIKAFIQARGKGCKPGAGTTCLKDRKFPTQNLPGIRGGCKSLSMSGNQAPWTIIHRTAQACGTNPQVILATLQKEQSGLTQPKSDATWAKAMGAGCPDYSGCNPKESGFQKQVYYGAEMLASYRIRSVVGYVDAVAAGASVTMKHNANDACGSETFKLQNVATASLYEYTPYIGNSSKPGCSATGQKNFWSLMKSYFGGGKPGKISEPPVTSRVKPTTVAGPDRYATNYAVNKANMKADKPLFVVTGKDFPDALSVGPVAGMLGGSIVLARPGGVDKDTLTLLKQHMPSAIYVIGGNGAVSEGVVSQLQKATGKTVDRVSGPDRYKTSEAVFQTFFGERSFGAPFVASGVDYPDALSAAAAGGALGRPVILVPGNSGDGVLPTSVAETLKSKGVDSVVLVGGTGVITSTVASNIEAQGFSYERVSGPNRYQTSIAVGNYVTQQEPGVQVEGIWVASGKGFADALSATAAAGSASQRLVLSSGSCLPSPALSSWVNGENSEVAKISIVGGTGALPGLHRVVTECR